MPSATKYHTLLIIVTSVDGSRDKSEESVKHKEPFTEFLVSARLKSIGLKLYSKDHPLVRLSREYY